MSRPFFFFFRQKKKRRKKNKLTSHLHTIALCARVDRGIKRPLFNKKFRATRGSKTLWQIPKADAMCLGNTSGGAVQVKGGAMTTSMANGKTNRRHTTRKRVNDGGDEDSSSLTNDEEEERDGITLKDLHACVLDSECAAAKKFGCGTTRFKTM